MAATSHMWLLSTWNIAIPNWNMLEPDLEDLVWKQEPCLFNLYAEYIMRNAWLYKAQAGIKIAWRNINNLRYAHDIILMAESEEVLKRLLMIVKGEWKCCLKTQHSKNNDHGIWSHQFMANRWGNNGNSDRLFSWVPKSLQMVTAAMKLKDACSLEEKLWQT